MNVAFFQKNIPEIISIIIIAFLLAHVSPIKAQTSYSYHDINIPSTVTVTGFNDKNLVVGFIASDNSGLSSKNGDSFVYDLNNKTTMTLPKFQQYTSYGNYYLIPSNINNNGDIPFSVYGAFASSADSNRYSPQIYNIYSTSSHSSRPSSFVCTFYINQINNLGQISGNSSGYDCIDHAFFYDPKLGYTSIFATQALQASQMSPSLNDDGLMVILHYNGEYSIYDTNKKTDTKLPALGRYKSINNKGHVAGSNGSSGFIYDLASSTTIGLLNIQDADRNSVNVIAINNNDTILGTYSKSGVAHHFLATPGSDSIKYIALGDSYSSGEGAGSYETGTDIRKVNQCHRSSKAWSTATPGGDSNASVPGIPSLNVERHFYACSGALTGSIVGPCDPTNSHKYLRTCENGPPDDKPQLEQASANLNQLGSNGMISMTIGGNDILFGKILEVCATRTKFGSVGDYSYHNCFSDPFPSDVANRSIGQVVTDSISSLYNIGNNHYNVMALKDTYYLIKEKTKDSNGEYTPIFILGYPNIFPLEDAFCTAGAVFNSNERASMRSFHDALENVIQQSAANAGVHFVSVTKKFDGHEICGKDDDWITSVFRFSQESGHPNEKGQLAYASALRDYIGGQKIPPNPAPTQKMMQTARSDATPAPIPPSIDDLSINPVQSLSCDNANRYAPGMQIHINGGGFNTDTTVKAEIRADFGGYVANLGSFTTNSQGDLDANVTIPADIPLTNGASLEVSGLGSDGAGRLLLGEIALVASPTPNTTGDGTPDICGNGNTTATITGRVWLDTNGNHVQDTGEPGIAGITVFLDLNQNGIRDGVGNNSEPSVVTDADGNYAITGLPFGGTFKLAVDASTLPAGLKPTFDPDGVATPNVASITVNAGWTSKNNNFGYAQNSGSTQTNTSIISETPDPSTIGQAVTVNYSVTAASGTPTGNVTVSDGASANCTGTVAAGSCSLTFTSAGSKTLTATYAGDTNFASSASTPVAHTVTDGNTPNTTFTGPSATGSGQVTAQITGESGCGFSQARLTPVSTIPTAPPGGYTFPHGLFAFTVTGCPKGALTLQVTYPQALPTGTKYWKFGKTADNHTAHWYEMPASIAGNQVTLTLADGGLGDDDLTANGAIVDDGGPGGLGGPATDIPTLSEWALLLLGLSLLVMIWRLHGNRLSPRPNS